MNCPTPLSKWHIIGFCLYAIGYALWEFWLGKTQKTNASSTLDFLIIGLGALVGIDLLARVENFFKKGK